MPDRAVLVIRRLRPIGEPSSAAPTAWPFVLAVEGTAGAGRICIALAELGVEVEALRQAVIDPVVDPADLEAFDLGARFDTVVLGSHLVNLPSAEARVSFLQAAVRHAAPGATVFVEHHPIDWAETAEATHPTPGSVVGMEDVRRDPPFVSAFSTYDIGGRYVRQPFTARVLSDQELTAALTLAGLDAPERSSPTWLRSRVAQWRPGWDTPASSRGPR